jgi:hypothetical protein
MPVAEFPFGEWLPDAANFKNPGLEVADNVIPAANGYQPFPSLVGKSQTVTGVVKGAEQLFDNSGNSIIVGGTNDRLFIRRATITETTGYSAIGDGEMWDFCQFNDFIIATSTGNAPQYLSDIDSDNTWSALGGSPPNAKRCAKVGDFLMLGNITSVPNRIQWSAFNSPTASWSASRLTQAGSADLPLEYGPVQRIVGGRYALVFQEYGISRLSYVGPPLVWRADPVSAARGTPAPFSVVGIGYLTYFLAQDGFYVTNGASIEAIGSRRINDWFFSTVDQGRIREVHGAVDWQNECIVWAFLSEGASEYDRLLVYSYAQNRWSSATVDCGYVVGSTLDAQTLDELDAEFGDLDSIPYSLDSDRFKAKNRRLAGFVPGSTTSEYSTFTGTPAEATIETGEFQPSAGQRVFVSEVAPLIVAESWDATVMLKYRDNRGVQTNSNTVATGWSGFAPLRAEGQKIAVQVKKPSGTDWTDLNGVQVRFAQAGYR